MRVLKRLCAFIYLVATVVTLGCLVGLLYPALAPGLDDVLEDAPSRIAVIAVAGVVALGVLVTVVRLMRAPRDRDALHPGGRPDVEVTVAALASTARTAVEREGVMVESVRCRISGSDRSQVHFTIEAIAFSNDGLSALADRIEARVARACEDFIGAAGVTCRVRFLPSKTTTTITPIDQTGAPVPGEASSPSRGESGAPASTPTV